MSEGRHQHHQSYPYHEQGLDKGQLMYEIYAAGYQDGGIVHPSSRIDYQYDGNSLIGETVTAYDEDGNVVSEGTVSYEWYTESTGPQTEIRRKVRV